MSRALHLVALAVLAVALSTAAWAQSPDPDINNDGTVDILDVSLVSSCLGMDATLEEPPCELADTDGDGDVDRDDLGFVTGSFGQGGFPPCGDANLDPGEECDEGDTENGDCCDEFCRFEASGSVCRPAAGPCDVPELCSGQDGVCPVDGFEPASVVCRPSAGACDVAESCSGAGPACPPDGFQPAGGVCRGAAGPCDAPETCTGAAPLCPPDGFLPAGAVCRPSAGSCDPAEVCSGAAAACPADVVAPNGTLCRPALGACDVAELCLNGGCPADVRLPAGQLCRAAVGECDLDEFCDGSPQCPADRFKAAGAGCGDQGIECRNDDTCNGAGACIDNGFEAAGTACGDRSDTECTDPDSCDGAGSCDPNHAAAGAACGDQGVDCREDDSCDGSGACTDRGLSPAGTACGDASDSECTDPDSCDAEGSCLANDAPLGAPCGDQGVDCRVDDSCDGVGQCQDNGLAPTGTACGDATAAECDDPDSCDAEGACQSNFAPLGAPCGDQGVECQVDDRCDGAGACQDSGPLPDGTSCTGVPVECLSPGSCQGGSCEPDAALNCDMDGFQDPICGEECDGADDAACPGLCRADCTCGMPPTPCTDACEPNSDPDSFGAECDSVKATVIAALPFCATRWDASCALQAEFAGAACPAGKVTCDGRSGDLGAFAIPSGVTSVTFDFVGDPALNLHGMCTDGTRFGASGGQPVTVAPLTPPDNFLACWSKVRADAALCVPGSTHGWSIEQQSPPDLPVIPIFNDGSCLRCDWSFDLDVCTASGCSMLPGVQLESHVFTQSVTFPSGDAFLEIVDRMPPEPQTVTLGNGITLQVDGTGEGCGPPTPSPSGFFSCGPFGSGPSAVRAFGDGSVGTCTDDLICESQCSGYCQSFPNFPFPEKARCVNNACECSCLEVQFGAAPQGAGFFEVPVTITVFENGTQTDRREGCRRLTTQQSEASVLDGMTPIFSASQTGSSADPSLCTAQGTALDTALGTPVVAATNLLLNLDLGTQGQQDVILSYTASPSCRPSPIE